MELVEETQFVTATLRHFTTKEEVDVDLPVDLTIEEATGEMVRAIGLPTIDLENHPQHYEMYVRTADQAERLNPSARVGEVVTDGAVLEAYPEVVPGGASA